MGKLLVRSKRLHYKFYRPRSTEILGHLWWFSLVWQKYRATSLLDKVVSNSNFHAYPGSCSFFYVYTVEYPVLTASVLLEKWYTFRHSSQYRRLAWNTFDKVHDIYQESLIAGLLVYFGVLVLKNFHIPSANNILTIVEWDVLNYLASFLKLTDLGCWSHLEFCSLTLMWNN